MKFGHTEQCMPFTPFHLGVGVAAKSLAPRLISLQVFALSQVAMDIEPGVLMARGADELHGWTHTLPGAVPVALACVIVWKILEGRRIWRWTFEPIRAAMLWTTVFVGVWSHVALDSLIHRDMASTRHLLALDGYGLLPHESVELACLAMAAIGGAVVAIRLGAQGVSDSFRALIRNLQQSPGKFERAASRTDQPGPTD
jgi:membrane-bound metal-dependent hydrolase YbcI (DUF457 family)